MRTRLVYILYLLLITCMCGCSILRDFETSLEEMGITQFRSSEDHSVAISCGGDYGRGAVIGVDRVITVAHVVAKAKKVWVATAGRRGWVRGHIVEHIPMNPESLVIIALELDQGIYGRFLGFMGFAETYDLIRRPFKGKLYGMMIPDCSPYKIITSRGAIPWQRGDRLKPGDSGSPVINTNGKLVGLLVGRRGNIPVLVPLPHLLSLNTDRLKSGSHR